MIKYIALDQATKHTGYSIWGLSPSCDAPSLLEYGMLKANVKNDVISRMREMYSDIKGLIFTHKPNYVFFEATQFQSNQRVYSTLSQLQGIVMAILFEKDIGFSIIEPSSWKSYCGITGRKREEQKAKSIAIASKQFGLSDLTDDVADAILIGYYGAHILNNEKGWRCGGKQKS